MAADSYAGLKLPWPDQGSVVRPGESVRVTLDYICYVAEEMLAIGFHAGSRRDEWRRRVHTAYIAMFRPIIKGFGDPYPPDVPPARNPGIWPDVPATGVPGMTLRHQLTVIRMLCEKLRGSDWLHVRKTETDEWEQRLGRVFAALDHGEGLPLPDDAKSEPSAAVLESAQVEQRARSSKAKKREEQLRLQMERMVRKRAEAAAAPKKSKAKSSTAAVVKAPVVKAPAKKAAAKKKAVAKKTASKASPKKAAKKKAVAKKTASKASPKKAAKKKAAAKKTASKKKKAAAKKTAKK